MSQTNGTTTTETSTKVDKPAKPAEYKPYRPEASTDKVRQAVENAFREIVHEATRQAGDFAHLVFVDREESTAVRYGHLVDAAECLEIAMTHLAMLKSALAYRLRIEDDTNIGTPPDNAPGW
jgi:hypothetical protein